MTDQTANNKPEGIFIAFYEIPTWSVPESIDSDEVCPICGGHYWNERYETAELYVCYCDDCKRDFIAYKAEAQS